MAQNQGIVVSPEQIYEINQILSELMEECPAQLALLIDQSGSVLSYQGENQSIDLVVLAALVAGDLCASQEIARLTGQYQKFQLIIREGELSNTILSEAGDQIVIYLQVSKASPLGWVRLRLMDACKKLRKIEFQAPEKINMDSDTKDGNSLSNLTDDALDAMWIN
jgi:predicted regulator of Ras-like GTPase activity (Roadblock/LC7/MglB family)